MAQRKAALFSIAVTAAAAATATAAAVRAAVVAGEVGRCPRYGRAHLARNEIVRISLEVVVRPLVLLEPDQAKCPQ